WQAADGEGGGGDAIRPAADAGERGIPPRSDRVPPWRPPGLFVAGHLPGVRRREPRRGPHGCCERDLDEVNAGYFFGFSDGTMSRTALNAASRTSASESCPSARISARTHFAVGPI